MNNLAHNDRARFAFKPGDWNLVRIEAIGNRLRTFLNRVPAADFKDDLTPEGFIALQVHGVPDAFVGLEVRWKNIRIQENPEFGSPERSPIAPPESVLPEKVEVTISADLISVKGPLGTLSQAITSNVKVEKIDNQLEIKLNEDTRQANAISGTLRALIANMVQGVSKGFERKLTLVGVGYRAQAQGDKLNLTLGFSHPVVHQVPVGVKVETPTQTEIIIKGADKQQVGQVAADVRN